jgi:hypothetical protein
MGMPLKIRVRWVDDIGTKLRELMDRTCSGLCPGLTNLCLEAVDSRLHQNPDIPLQIYMASCSKRS